MLRYPYNSVDSAQQPFWLNFFSAPYSLKNNERTREGVLNRAQIHISLPMPKEPGYQIQHNFGESNANPVGPMISKANLANSGDVMTGLARVLQPALFYHERLFATSTYRRFSNITELSMVSEGRRQYFFQYLMVPKNNIENDVIDGICGTFRKASYPVVANFPERTYPQNLWCLQVTPGSVNAGTTPAGDLTANWLGEPLVCVLQNVIVKKNDDSDPVVRYTEDARSALTLLGLLFTEFETGTYVPETNQLKSKSEISYDFFGPSR